MGQFRNWTLQREQKWSDPAHAAYPTEIRTERTLKRGFDGGV